MTESPGSHIHLDLEAEAYASQRRAPSPIVSPGYKQNVPYDGNEDDITAVADLDQHEKYWSRDDDILSSSDEEGGPYGNNSRANVNDLRQKLGLPVKVHRPQSNSVSPSISEQMIEESKKEEIDPHKIMELKRIVQEKNIEIRNLEEALLAVEPIPGLDPDKFLRLAQGGQTYDHDARDAKIRDLVKKNRGLRVHLQREKDRAERMKRERDALQLQGSSIPHRNGEIRTASSDRELQPTNIDGRENIHMPSIDQTEIKELRTQMKNMTQRNEKLTLKVERIQSELRLAHKALQKEVGDTISIEDILQATRDGDTKTNHVTSSGWRGRAQQIVMLKTKMKRLQQKLKEKSTNDTLNVSSRQTASEQSITKPVDIGSGHTTWDTQDDVDLKAEQHLNSLAEQKQRREEQLETELQQALEKEIENREKVQRAKARVKVLESSIHTLKSHIQTLKDKSNNDDQLVDALRRRMEQLEKQIKTLQKNARNSSSPVRVGHFGTSLNASNSQLLDSNSKPLSETMNSSDDHIQSLEKQSRDQKRRLDTQEKIITSLKDEIQTLRSENESLVKQVKDTQLQATESYATGSHTMHRATSSSSNTRKLAEAETEALENHQELRLLREQTIKLQEHIRLLEARTLQAEDLTEQYMRRSNLLETRCREFDEQSKSGKSRPESGKSVHQQLTKIKAELATVLNEKHALQNQHHAAISARDNEIQQLRNALIHIQSISNPTRPPYEDENTLDSKPNNLSSNSTVLPKFIHTNRNIASRESLRETTPTNQEQSPSPSVSEYPDTHTMTEQEHLDTAHETKRHSKHELKIPRATSSNQTQRGSYKTSIAQRTYRGGESRTTTRDESRIPRAEQSDFKSNSTFKQRKTIDKTSQESNRMGAGSSHRSRRR